MANKKNIIALGSSVASLVIAGIIFTVPLGFNVPGSMNDMSKVKADIEKFNSEQEENFNQLTELRIDTKNKELELDTVKESYEESQKLFTELLEKQKSSGEWGYHVPSLLIELETFADSKNLSIAIDYDSLNGEGEYVSSSGKGLKVVKSKVELYGEYANVQAYIKNIEDIDFLSVDDLVLNRVESGDLAGNFTLSVYYME